jgi:hypothetical protein
MMLTHLSRTQIVVGLWLAALTGVGVLTVIFGARWSTTTLLLLICAVPMGVSVLLGLGGAHSLSTRELLYARDDQTGGRQ